jgi:thiamine pyrophosphate-dependent acetolactate synthase large subunit-like protein
MRTLDLIARALKHAGTRYLFCFPTTPVIEACAQAGIKPIICRQERVGVGIADGYSRVSNGVDPGVFAMQFGPGAENAYAGIATAYSDSVPILLLPLGHPLDRLGVAPLFSARDGYRSVAKVVEVITSPDRTVDTLRRAFAALRLGRFGPVVVEIPADVAVAEAASVEEPAWATVQRTVSAGDPADVLAAATAVCAARRPVVLAGQGVLYAQASEELVGLAEFLSLPVATTLLGKSAFPELHPLALGCASQVQAQPAAAFIDRADLIVAVGSSLTRHAIRAPLPKGVPIVQITDNPADLHKDYPVEHPILGDARRVLAQLVEACRDILPTGRQQTSVSDEISALRGRWLAAWLPKLTSNQRPINPYRVIHEFSRAFDPADCIVTHDSGNPRGQVVPFYRSAGPRSFLGWGMSHGLGTSLGLTIGAKLAQPDKICVSFMGDAAFGMVGLDFETAVRHGIPILSVVLNNSGMASEVRDMPFAEAAYATSYLGGEVAAIARALGGHAERVVDPDEIRPALLRALSATRDGHPALVECITAREMALSDAASGFSPRSGPPDRAAPS